MSAVDEIAAYLAHLKTGGNRIDQIIFDELPNGEGMSATDGLRRLLDERGVEWGNIRNDGSESDYLTEWQFDGVQSYAVATEWSVGGGLSVEINRHHLTPEQAVEATLGKGTCHNEGDSSDFCCSECGLRMYVETDDTYTMATDERVLELPNYCPNCGAKVVDV